MRREKNVEVKFADINQNDRDPLLDDGSEFLASFAGIETLRTHLEEHDNDMSAVSNRDAKRPGTNVAYREIWHEAWLTGCRIANGILDTDDQTMTIRSMILSTTNKSAAAENFADYMTGSITDFVKVYRLSSDLAEDTVSQIENKVYCSNAAMYRHAKILSSVVPREIGFGAWTHAQTYATMLALNRSGLFSATKQSLEDGSFDTYIAADVLRFVATEPNYLANGMDKFKKLISFLKSYDSCADTETVITKLINNYESLPTEYRTVIGTSRDAMFRRLVAVEQWSHSRAGAGNGLALDMYHESADEAFVTAVGQVLKLRSGPGDFGSKILTPAQKARISPPKEKRRQLSTVSEAVVKTVLMDVEREPYKLAGITMYGDLNANETATTTKSVVGDFLRRYGYSHEMPIVGYAYKVIDGIRRLDMSNGVIPGLIKLRDIQINDPNTAHRSLGVFEYKPFNVAGLSSSAERAAKIRVIMTFLNAQTIGVIAILERDDVADFFRNYGKSYNAR